MAQISFPVLPSGAKADSSQFSESYADPAIRSEMEGGYTITRARHTRLPQPTFKVALGDLTNADKDVLTNFYRAVVRGGSVMFDWENPQSLEIITVRFGKEGLSWTYTGIKNRHRWNCSFSLEAV